jgi:hypothetical protein
LWMKRGRLEEGGQAGENTACSFEICRAAVRRSRVRKNSKVISNSVVNIWFMFISVSRTSLSLTSPLGISLPSTKKNQRVALLRNYHLSMDYLYHIEI